MIKISYINPVPDNMDPQQKVYRDELGGNIQMFRHRNRKNDEPLDFNFRGYENAKNKNIVRAITNGRCAYCGVRTTDSSQLEIEHYRPKKRLNIRSNEFILHKASGYLRNAVICDTVRHGYFKLGSDYKNLLPSCAVCNKGIDGGGLIVGRNIIFSVGYGKRNFFPVMHKKKGGVRIDYRRGFSAILNVKDEVPLLFNPYVDNPESLFVYKKMINVDGAFYIKVGVKKNICKLDRLKANISINLLGLNRIGLCKRRYNIFCALMNLYRNIKSDHESETVNLVVWAKYAIDCSNYFDSSIGEFIGFAKTIGGRIPQYLHDKLIDNFPVEASIYLTANSSFEQLIRELKSFGDHYYDENNFYDDIDLNGI